MIGPEGSYLFSLPFKYPVMVSKSRDNQAAFNRIDSTDCETVRSVPGSSCSLKKVSISSALASVAKFSVKYLISRANRKPPCNQIILE